MHVDRAVWPNVFNTHPDDTEADNSTKTGENISCDVRNGNRPKGNLVNSTEPRPPTDAQMSGQVLEEVEQLK